MRWRQSFPGTLSFGVVWDLSKLTHFNKNFRQRENSLPTDSIPVTTASSQSTLPSRALVLGTPMARENKMDECQQTNEMFKNSTRRSQKCAPCATPRGSSSAAYLHLRLCCRQATTRPCGAPSSMLVSSSSSRIWSCFLLLRVLYRYVQHCRSNSSSSSVCI